MAGPRGEGSNVGRGAITAVLLISSFIALFLVPRARELTAARFTLYADFRTITGLRSGSPVQIAGMPVGEVDGVDFVRVRYACDPFTEDVGRHGQGRTDSCDQDLFCAPTGYCADLEPYVGKGHHGRCDATADCAEDEVCFTGDFRRRETHLMWGGPRGVCARFNIDHTRTRVRMEVPATAVNLIRADSRAVIAANSVLGDQMVNISSGRGDELCPSTRPDIEGYTFDDCVANMRVQARRSLAEDIDRLRKRVDSFMDKADLSILAIANVIDELQSEETMNSLQGMVGNLAVISRDVAYGEGLVGALLNSPQYRKDIGVTLHALNTTSQGLERAAGQANHVMGTLDRNLEPFLTDTEATLEGVDELLLDLEDPANKSLTAKLLRDDTGNITRDLEQIFENTAALGASAAEITEAIDEGRGTLGLLIKDDQVGRDLGRLLDSLARHDVLRGIALWYLEKRRGAISVTNARRSSRP